MKFSFLIAILLLAQTSQAFLPLPFPVDEQDEDQTFFEMPAQDPGPAEGYSELHLGGKLREMELASFEGQSSVMGYEEVNAFAVPETLKNRVAFWKKIYSEYTSDQAVLHDAQVPELVYEVVDISPYTRANLPYRKQMKLVGKLMKQKKAEITKKLKTIEEGLDNPSTLSLELFSLFKKFESIHEPQKFQRAANRIRVQVGQRDRIVKGFFYGGRYLKRMMEIFEEMGLPKELTRLPLVESAFNIHARSKVGASGVWQFMRSTGKLYLHIDKSVDDRNDPIRATYAAAQLLRQNFETLRSWPLAITAYNHGREGMARAVRTLATTELPEIIRNYKASTFGFASSNFFSEFLAILEVEREYRKHFGKLMVDSPPLLEELTVATPRKFSHWIEKCRISKTVLSELNPSLTEFVTSGRGEVPAGFSLKVPQGDKAKCLEERVSLTDNNYDRMRLRSISKKGL